jgi:small-conductance mechanosensitive channel
LSIPGFTVVGWRESILLLSAAGLLLGGGLRRFRSWRPLFWGASALMLITAIFPRHGNPLGQYLFVGPHGDMLVPAQIFGIAWWLLGAWLVKSLFGIVLRRTIFPDDNVPHARRLFADLASGLIYVVAFVGIMDTVFKQPLSGVLATSGVLAIVLGLALQSTLADVFSGLAINIERPFSAGDWITVTDTVEGQVMEINWRATRIRKSSNDMTVVPNSVIAKGIVTNHSRLRDPNLSTIRLSIDCAVPPARVIDILQTAASCAGGIAAEAAPLAYACQFADGLIEYELVVASESYTQMYRVRSEVIGQMVQALDAADIRIGAPPTDVRIVNRSDGVAAELARVDRRIPATSGGRA